MKVLARFALLALLFPLLASASSELINPIRGDLPAGVSDADAGKAIQLAFLDLGWIIKSATPGSVKAHIELRGRHQADVEAKWDATGVSIFYVDSVDLDYEPCDRGRKGSKMCIHDNYHSWVQNVITALPNALQKLRLFGVIAPKVVLADPGQAPAPVATAPATPAPVPAAVPAK